MNVAQSVSESTGSAGVAIWLTSVILSVALYVWTAWALSALFRKSGEEGWKGWVPCLNLFVVLQLGGFSGWLVLLILIPGPGTVAVYVLIVVAAHRLNAAFGYGAGMTVLAALIFPAWASVLGFGPARWVGPVSSTGTYEVPLSLPLVGRRGSPVSSAVPVYDPPFDPEMSRARLDLEVKPEPVGSAGSQELTGFSGPTESSGFTGSPDFIGSSDFTGSPDFAGPPGSVRSSDFAKSSDFTGSSDFAKSSDLIGSSDFTGSSDLTGSSDFTPEPWGFPPTPRAEAGAVRGWGVDPDEDADGDRDAPPDDRLLDPLERWTAVTGDAPAAPAGPGGDDGPIASVPRATAFPVLPPAPPTAPLVLRAPFAPPESAEPEPWAPRRSSTPAADDPYDDTGEVSAVVGAPEAGAPRSALAAVSAQHTRPEVPDDVMEETVITRRRRVPWVLVPPIGAPIDIFSDIVILGRRPAADPAYPKAQLVPLSDDTRTVSKTHARLELRGDSWFVTDLGSTNGVLLVTLMGTEMDAEPGVELAAGERFYLGDAEVRLQRNDG